MVGFWVNFHFSGKKKKSFIMPSQNRFAEKIKRTNKYPTEVLVQIPRSICRTFDFYMAQNLIGECKEAFMIALKKYEEKEHG